MALGGGFGVAWKLLEHYGCNGMVARMKVESRGVSDFEVSAKR